MDRKRDFGLDLLRIVSMMMVVCGHFFSHGDLVEGTLISGEVNWILGNIVYVFTGVAVNCFVLLSGYFQCTSGFNLKRFVSVWIQAAFYSLVLYVLTGLMSGGLSVSELVKNAMVMTQQRYWFVTAYLLMYAVSPFLNCAIRVMSRKMHLLCCMVLLGIFSVAHNLVYVSDFGYVQGGSSFLWFCVLYVTAAYIRLHVPVVSEHRNRWLVGYIVCAGMIALERFAAYLLTPLVFGRVVLDSFFYANNSIMNTAAAISLFMAMRATSINSRGLERLIGIFAPLSFGVYLIHDHPAVRTFLWEVLDSAGSAQAPWMIPYALVCTVGIFLACSLIEWLRIKIFHVLRIDRGIESLSDKIQNKVQLWLNAE